MDSIVQGDGYGCGVACVANVLGVSYGNSIALFAEGKSRAKTEGFYCQDIVSVLKSRGLDYDFKYIKPRLRKYIYKEGVIVFIKRSKKYPAGHFLSRKNGFWQDPWMNFPEITRKAGIRKRLPGKPIYYLYLCGDGRV